MLVGWLKLIAMNNSFSAVVLDFDGTVGDTEFSIISTAQSTLAALNLPPVPDSSIKALIGVPLRDVFGSLSGNHDDDFLDFAASTYRRIYVEENSIAKVTLFPDVASTLSALHAAGVFLAIASSRGHASLEMITEHLGINGFIGMIVGAEDVPKSKPAPDMVLKILDSNSFNPDAALVVGDTSFDIAMGHSAGCRTCGVSYGNHPVPRLKSAGADYIISGFSQLLDLVL